jgi:hypothetical protein
VKITYAILIFLSAQVCNAQTARQKHSKMTEEVFHNILPFRDFEKISAFVRCYGNRKTFGNRWNHNPHFSFPFGSLYLIPYGENPFVEKPHPYAYNGFYFQSEELTFSLNYIDRETVTIQHFRQHEKAIRAIIEKVTAIASSYIAFDLQDEYLMKNEGILLLLPMDPEEKNIQLKLQINVVDEMFNRPVDKTGIPVVFNKINELNLSIEKRDATLLKIEPETAGQFRYSWIFHFTINNSRYYVPVSFFDRQGSIVEIYDDLVLKIYLNKNDTENRLPDYYYYKIELIEPVKPVDY